MGCGQHLEHSLLNDTLYRWRQSRWSTFKCVSYKGQLARDLFADKLLDLKEQGRMVFRNAILRQS